MNARVAHSLNSQFGPPSEPIDIGEFIQDASTAIASTSTITEEFDEALVEECSVDDIRSSLSEIWNDTQKSSFICKEHENTITFLYGGSKSARARKKPTREPISTTEEQLKLRSKMDNIKLASWKTPSEATLFIRAPKQSDFNIYNEIETTPESDSMIETSPQALITFSVHKRFPWRANLVSRSSQHCVLSSQSLGDLVDAIPCTSNELPAEKREGARVVGYNANERMKGDHGAVIAIGNLIYGDGMSETDYAEKLLKHAEKFQSPIKLEKAPSAMHDMLLKDLSLVVNEPYWLLHEGNCEHFVVIDGIRLRHTSDPPSGYPITIHREPTVVETCVGCTKAPAIWAIVGDIRLGESPCFLCDWCWKAIGEPSEGVVVVPLPKHELGWI